MYDFSSMTPEQFITEAKRLRQAYLDSEKAWYNFLASAEEHTHLWQGSGQDFLKFCETQGLLRDRQDVSRFSSYRRAVKTLPPEVVEKAPVKILAHVGRLRGAPEMKEAIDRALIAQKSNGHLTDSQAQRIVKEQQTVRAAQKSGNKSYSVLVKENEKLREENERLRQQVALLKEEVKKFRAEKKLAKKSKTKHGNAHRNTAA